MTDDTIFALSSGALPAAIAVVRVSGPAAEQAVATLVGTLPQPRRASLRLLRAGDGSLIDEALVLCFPAPHTATGEPLVELHLHGGRAVVARLLAELATIPGLREAEAGEFTRRALFNGRIDLTQAEGLGDLLSAETEWQRRSAVESAGGNLRRKIESWRARLVALSAQTEAAIDYVGDEDETAIDLSGVAEEAAALADEWRSWLARPSAELLQHGLRVVLGGPPNSGKSSLFNALVGAEKAIVTPIAGTTRDVIETRLDLGGIPLVLVDTAGLRDSDDTVERIGIARAEAAQRDADILLWLGDADDAPSPNAVRVHAKADVRGAAASGSIPVSVIDSGGIEGLRAVLDERARSLLPPIDGTSLNRRQRTALEEAADALSVSPQDDAVILAHQLSTSLRALDRITGRESTEDVLDSLFGRFCLGK